MNGKNTFRQRFTRKNAVPTSLPSVPAITGTFNIAGATCQVKEGLVNLTDLWKASGEGKGSSPADWFNRTEAIVFIQETAKSCTGSVFYPQSPGRPLPSGRG